MPLHLRGTAPKRYAGRAVDVLPTLRDVDINTSLSPRVLRAPSRRVSNRRRAPYEPNADDFATRPRAPIIMRGGVRACARRAGTAYYGPEAETLFAERGSRAFSYAGLT